MAGKGSEGREWREKDLLWDKDQRQSHRIRVSKQRREAYVDPRNTTHAQLPPQPARLLADSLSIILNKKSWSTYCLFMLSWITLVPLENRRYRLEPVEYVKGV